MICKQTYKLRRERGGIHMWQRIAVRKFTVRPGRSIYCENSPCELNRNIENHVMHTEYVTIIRRKIPLYCIKKRDEHSSSRAHSVLRMHYKLFQCNERVRTSRQRAFG